ncbi:hypothetical protein HZC32_02540 [Candidatus Woesearchaeota archaeon]|nr:hypothetical protein [Candidatus Woesearchaeota archaeon]
MYFSRPQEGHKEGHKKSPHIFASREGVCLMVAPHEYTPIVENIYLQMVRVFNEEKKKKT